MTHRILLLLAVTLALGGRGVLADEYDIDPVHSSIGFSISHLVINKVRGTFDEFTAHLAYDPGATPPVTAASTTIKAASINTRIKKRDDDLRSPNFFNVEKYPELTFTAKKITGAGNDWIAHGTLTIHGVPKEIDLPFKVNGPIKDPWGKTRLGVEASTTISRKDFGITWNKVLEAGGVMLGDEVTIDIQAEFVKK